MMDATEVAGLRALADAATEGPWQFDRRRGVVTTPHGCLWNPRRGAINDPADGEFIVAVRMKVTALLDALVLAQANVTALEGRLAAVEQVAPALCDLDENAIRAVLAGADVQDALRLIAP